MMKYRLNTRRFLNNLGFHSSAHIIAQVENTELRNDGAHEKNCKAESCRCFDYPLITLIIADCSRSISLDFELGSNYEERRNTFDKIDGLIADLIEFRAALGAEASWQGQVRKNKREAKAATKI